MPHLRIETNLPGSKIPTDFAIKTTAIVAKALGKPENYCVVTIVGDVQMTWGGNANPCAIATLMSIGQLGVAENKKHSAVISKHVQEKLGIPADRMYIVFNDARPEDVGYNGTTFHDIFGGV